jgi:hypothetical protein
VRSAHSQSVVAYSVEAARRLLGSASSLLSSGSEANASDLRTIAFDFASRAAAASMPFVRLGRFCVNSDDISFFYFYGDKDECCHIVFKQPGREVLNVGEVFSSVERKLSATGGSH